MPLLSADFGGGCFEGETHRTGRLLQKLTPGKRPFKGFGLPLTAYHAYLPSALENQPILQTKNLRYSYPNQAEISFPDLVCDRGADLLIAGNSGSGKTTLLHLISGLLRVQSGEVRIAGTDLGKMSQGALDKFRGSHIGLVFQQPRFITALTAVDNVTAAQYFGTGKSNKAEAVALLEALGIAEKAGKPTGQLSGGERQRLAIARALAAKPAVVMADEPTSALDDENADLVSKLLARQSAEYGAALVIVTHDNRLKAKFKNTVTL